MSDHKHTQPRHLAEDRITPASVQEGEYAFPYHYVSQWRPGFTQHFLDSWGIHYVSTIEFLLETLDKEAPESIIDVGCGDGRMSRELALRFPASRVFGIDYSAQAINLARAMNPGPSRPEFAQLDITTPHDLPRFDVAVLMEVFEHIPPESARDFLDGIRRVLKPGGLLLVTVPHVNHGLEPKHYRHFTGESLQEALSEFFTVEKVMPFERNGLQRKALRFLLCNPLFVLNSQRLLQAIYRYYKRKLFFVANESVCRRLFVRAVAK